MKQSPVISVNNLIEIEQCGGGRACAGIAASGERLINGLRSLSERLEGRVAASGEAFGPHRKFRISLSFCTNGCSRPQISDIGIIGAVTVRVDAGACTGCGACVAACRENALMLDGPTVSVGDTRCLFCGDCLCACPFDALLPGATGFKVLLGGKLGRHPRLGTELPGIYTEHDIIEIVSHSYHLYASYPPDVRFGDIIEKRELGWLPDKPAADRI
jgi:dissimilatory sulfite reductase (desulfoviridin) alpha/beta subunit